MKSRITELISFFKKNDWLFWMLIVVIVLIPVWILNYNRITSNSKYALGTTTESYVAKGYRKQTDYTFFVEGKKLRGSYTELSINARDDIVVPNGKYLVIYAVEDPEVSILLIDKPIKDTIDLDSLNTLGVDKSDIHWLDL